MNILPKKRWHVRTKDNIARVRRDEAEAREAEQKREAQLKLAESEARINFLRNKSGVLEKCNEKSAKPIESKEDTPQEHIDLFADYKTHVKATNKELEKEKKEEKEKYEKQIGYLTYLGQDTNEALRLKSWYEIAPRAREILTDPKRTEKDLKSKHVEDPLTLINALLPKKEKEAKSTNSKRPLPSDDSHKPLVANIDENRKIKYDFINPKIEVDVSPAKKRKLNEDTEKRRKKESRSTKKRKKLKKRKEEKHSKKPKKDKKQRKKERKKSSSEDEEDPVAKRLQLELLRKERIKRETEERQRAEQLLASLNPANNVATKTAPTPKMKQRYNSQFNPEIAKQNMI